MSSEGKCTSIQSWLFKCTNYMDKSKMKVSHLNSYFASLLYQVEITYTELKQNERSTMQGTTKFNSGEKIKLQSFF